MGNQGYRSLQHGELVNWHQRFQKRRKLKRQIRRLRREKLDLEVDYSTLIHDPSPSYAPMWLHQKLHDSGDPLLVAIKEKDIKIRRLEEELKDL